MRKRLIHKRLIQLKALSWEEWQILLTSLVLLPLIALSLRIKGFKWTQSRLQARVRKRAAKTNSSLNKTDIQREKAQSLSRMVAVAANYGPYRANCLKRSLILWYLLQRRSLPVQLHIGVNKGPAKGPAQPALKAHAWVEYAGTRLGEADDISEQYSSFGPQ